LWNNMMSASLNWSCTQLPAPLQFLRVRFSNVQYSCLLLETPIVSVSNRLPTPDSFSSSGFHRCTP
ncbi:hypothetical protein FRX31_023612, partial [Thalictrum thalictroides]